jgi:CRP/FNR family cyclic AMP-dependent transcriptional regulator
MARRSKPADAAHHLAGVAFFEGFTSEQLDRVAALCDEVDVESGAGLMEQGRPGQEAYVIVSGTAGVYIGGNLKAELSDGELVGEMALIDHRPRTADVRALTDMVVLAFDAERFRRLLDEMPKAQVRVMELLVERLRGQNLDG